MKFLKRETGNTVINLIQDSDESSCRQRVEQLVYWYCQNHLYLNLFKTGEMIVEKPPNNNTAQHPRQLIVYCGHLQFSGLHNFSGQDMDLQFRHCLEKAPAEVMHPKKIHDV